MHDCFWIMPLIPMLHVLFYPNSLMKYFAQWRKFPKIKYVKTEMINNKKAHFMSVRSFTKPLFYYTMITISINLFNTYDYKLQRSTMVLYHLRDCWDGDLCIGRSSRPVLQGHGHIQEYILLTLKLYYQYF